MEKSLEWWIGFNVFVLAMLALDLGVFHRKAHEVRFREAAIWSMVWIAMALLFNLGIWKGWLGPYEAAERAQRAQEFLAGYLVEKALSVDNIFVFAVIFSYFAVPPIYQHRVLFYGILGALIFRAIFIFTGVWLIERFEWTLYIFAVFLVLTGIKMIWAKDKKMDPEHNPVVRLVRKIFPVTDEYFGQKFFTRIADRLWVTPLFLVLCFVEFTDIIFAVDSIPAILIITNDPFIVFTSNVFAILGLRALYFCLAGFIQMFTYLTYGLAFILMFIGGKMFYQAIYKALHGVEYKVSIGLSLGVIGALLALSVAASWTFPPKKQEQVTV
ncbi:MAG: putative membrane-bound redox modulator Alx [Phycisphaerae bacterium]|nr:putative membrane-bound redox modulator Alx [Phycisphaerae bacterium]